MPKYTATLMLVGWLCAGPGFSLRAADEAVEKPKSVSPDDRNARLKELREKYPEEFEKLREELKDLPPQERQKRLRELREKRGGVLREELEKRRDEFSKLSPQEREARMKELRERMAERRKAMTPDERKLKRQEIKSRLEKQLGEVQKRKDAGTITLQESKRLERLETIGKRFKQAQEQANDAKPAKP